MFKSSKFRAARQAKEAFRREAFRVETESQTVARDSVNLSRKALRKLSKGSK